MSDAPRGPLDRQPDEPGWWVASDGKWYPPELAAPTEAVPITSGELTAIMPTVPSPRANPGNTRAGGFRSWPLWAKVAAPVAIVLLIAAVAGAVSKSSKPTVTMPAVTTTQAPPSPRTDVPVRPTDSAAPSAAPATAPTTSPRTSPRTSPPPTSPPTTPKTAPPTSPPTSPATSPATAPPPTVPPAPG